MVSPSSSSSSYLQKTKKNPSGAGGYGSIEATPLVQMGDDEDNNVELFVKNQPRYSSSKLVMLGAIASLLILGAVVYLPGVGSSSLLRSSSSDASLMNLLPMLGKSKLTTEEKLAAKQEGKQEAKEAKKLAKAQAKQAKKDAKAKAKAEKDKAKEAKKQAKEAAKFHPSPYPGCLEVNVTYVATPLSFEAHEMAANASGCHLASIHSIRENTKLARAGLFELSSGFEIASTFTSGALLTKDYYLGGKAMGGNWTWTDGSDWDFGIVSLATTTGSCLTAHVNFTEIVNANISYTDHWEASEDCEIPLPAIYKCCLTPSPSTAPVVPEEDETEE